MRLQEKLAGGGGWFWLREMLQMSLNPFSGTAQHDQAVQAASTGRAQCGTARHSTAQHQCHPQCRFSPPLLC